MDSDKKRRSPTPTKLERPRPSVDSVLRLIWSEQQISRADIARHTDLARSTVSEIVGALLPSGLVAEVGPGPSRGGRRPIVLEFIDEACLILGVEMGATHVAVALTDLRGRILSWQSQDHAVRDDPKGTRDLMLELCKRCLADGPQGKPLVGIGIAVPSPVDPKHPEQLSEIVLPEWKNQNGFEVIKEYFGTSIVVDNDANLGALAERWWGACRDVEDFAYVKVGTGIGSGHVIDGEIYRGATGVAGEIGHMAIDPQGGPCLCGLRGCLVTKIGAQALVARVEALLPKYPDTSLRGKTLDLNLIEDAALAGDPLALEIATESAEYLGTALASMINLLNPARVIIGGGLARLHDILLVPLRETVSSRTLVSSIEVSEIRTSSLGPQAVAVGAATLVLKAALADPRRFPKPQPSTVQS